jgi:hypothetical protein
MLPPFGLSRLAGGSGSVTIGKYFTPGFTYNPGDNKPYLMVFALMLDNPGYQGYIHPGAAGYFSVGNAR